MLQNSENSNNVLSMDGGFVLFDSNNSAGNHSQGYDGNWSMHSVDVTDSVTMVDFLVDGDRWHLTSTNYFSGNNNIVWTTGLFSDSSIKTLPNSSLPQLMMSR